MANAQPSPVIFPTHTTTLPPSQLPHAHTPPLPQSFDWNSIWNIFMSAPATRSWLFQRQAPDTTHVIRSLLNTPVLLGYVFGAHISPQPYAFPDIGDLHTVFSRDAHTTLGFHFGFQGVNPIVPVVFQVSKDPFLSNPNVTVRRTAKRLMPDANCILAIEFNWLVSGALAVHTSVHPLPDPHSDQPHLTPYFKHAEMRIFKRATVERFTTAVQLLHHNLPHSLLTPQISHCINDFFHPPDQYYSVIIDELSDSAFFLAPSDCDAASTFSPCAPHNFYAQPQMLNGAGRSAVNSTVPSDSAVLPFDGTSGHTSPPQAPATQQCEVVTLWNSYQRQVSQARTTGVFRSMISRKGADRFAKPERLFGRQAQYTFLCTTGIDLKGRIHRLCAQIGIDVANPRTDAFVLDSASVLGVRKRELDDGGALLDGAERVLDIEPSLSESELDWKRRKLYDSGDSVLEAVADRGDGTEQAVEDGFKTPPLTPSIAVLSPSGNVFSSVSTGVDMDCSVDGRLSSGRNGNGGTTAKRQRTLDSQLRMEDESALSPSATPVLGQAAVKPNINKLVKQARERTLNLYSGQGQVFTERIDVKCIMDLGEVISDGDVEVSGDWEKGNNKSGKETGAAVGAEEKRCKRGKSGSATIWKCERCGVNIRGKKGNLNRHIANKHENIRAYACKVATCGKRFQTRLNLVRHEKAVHQGRPFKCASCPRTFKSDKDLCAHVSTAHAATDGELACHVCGSCFGRRSTLNRHLAKVHKIAVGAQQHAATDAVVATLQL